MLASTRKIPKSAISVMETLLFTRSEAAAWVVPPFQRPLRVNEKVRALAEDLKTNGGFISGVITLGKLKSDKSVYIVDGQHRIEAFKISDLPEAIADVRTCTFESMAEMADEFVLLQQSLVRMRPDDVLRGMEASTHSLQVIRKVCPFVGYDNIRRTTYSSVVGMSQVLRSWSGSAYETPVAHKSSETSAQIAKEMDDLEVTNLCKYLHLAHSAWSTDPGYGRLWSALNNGLCMWLYRRMVLENDSKRRHSSLTGEQFRKCLMSISANEEHIDWLANRNMTDHHRVPAYRRLKSIFAARMKEEGIEAARFPQPAWAASTT